MTSGLALPSSVLGVQAPRICLVPPAKSSALGEIALEVCQLAGLHLDEWQKFWLVNSLAVREDQKWAALEVGGVVPRQNGKGGVEEGRELVGLFAIPDERTLIHSAHEQATSSEHQRRLLQLIEGVPDFDREVQRVKRGKGEEAIELRDGSRILFKTRTSGGGRGFTGDLVVFDEAMVLPEAFVAALGPTLAARSIKGNPQLWYAGSAVDKLTNEHGVVLSRVRARALRGASRLMYVEWSAEGDNPGSVPAEVLDDPQAWAQANPGLGIRISLEHIRSEREGLLGPRAFAVERLGIGDWPDPDPDSGWAVIGAERWQKQADPGSEAVDPVCFAFAVTPNRSHAAVGVAGVRPDGAFHIGVQEHREGTGWVALAVAELVKRYGALAVVCRGGSTPDAALVPAFANLGIQVQTKNSSDFARASGVFYDLIDQGSLWHRGTLELANAVKGAKKRELTDGWAWSQKLSAVDITPLVACTTALGGLVDAGALQGGIEF